MEQNKKTAIIVIGVILVIIAVTLAVLSGSPNNQSSGKGTTNVIEFDDDKPSALEKYEEGLKELVQLGYLDTATHDVALAAGKKFDTEVISKSSTPIELITLSALQSKNYISKEVSDKLMAALEQQTAAVKKEKFTPLVTSGAFADIEKAETAYNSFFKHYQVLSDEQKAAMNKEIEAANPPLSDTDKKKRIAEFQKGQKQRIEDVLNKMVSASEITQLQADGLKELITKK